MHCQDCRRPLPPRRDRCMYCGGTAAPDRSSYRAPRCVACDGLMEAHTDPQKPISHCQRCDSLWFDRGTLEALLSKLEVQVLEAPGAAPPVRSPQAVEYRKCPSCQAHMKRHNYGRISGVIIDTCPQHGTFLDTGELQALEAFIRAGGMAAASRHQEKETQRLADTERRADRMVQTLRDGAPGTFFGHRPGHLLHKQNSLCLWMNSPLFDLL